MIARKIDLAFDVMRTFLERVWADAGEPEEPPLGCICGTDCWCHRAVSPEPEDDEQ